MPEQNGRVPSNSFILRAPSLLQKKKKKQKEKKKKQRNGRLIVKGAVVIPRDMRFVREIHILYTDIIFVKGCLVAIRRCFIKISNTSETRTLATKSLCLTIVDCYIVRIATECAMQWRPKDVKLSDNKHAYCCTSFLSSLFSSIRALLERKVDVSDVRRQLR